MTDAIKFYFHIEGYPHPKQILRPTQTCWLPPTTRGQEIQALQPNFFCWEQGEVRATTVNFSSAYRRPPEPRRDLVEGGSARHNHVRRSHRDHRQTDDDLFEPNIIAMPGSRDPFSAANWQKSLSKKNQSDRCWFDHTAIVSPQPRTDADPPHVAWNGGTRSHSCTHDLSVLAMPQPDADGDPSDIAWSGDRSDFCRSMIAATMNPHLSSCLPCHLYHNGNTWQIACLCSSSRHITSTDRVHVTSDLWCNRSDVDHRSFRDPRNVCRYLDGDRLISPKDLTVMAH